MSSHSVMANRLRGTNHASLVVGQIHGYEAARATTNTEPPPPFTNTAKLPIETVKKLIAAVSHRPNLWIRNHNGQKRCDLNQLWYEVSQEVQIPADVCRTKWGHLRDNFRKVFIRNTLSDETPTTWRFYSDMRFMEKAVAENIMRQNRFKDQSRCWPELHQEQLYESVPKTLRSPASIPPNFDLRDANFQRDDPQFNFSDVSAFFTESPPNKRIKLELQSLESALEKRLSADKKIVKKTMGGGFASAMSDDYTQPDPDDDDEFDEDAATEENDHDNNNTESSPNRDIFTIEVFDDDDDDVDKKAPEVKVEKSESQPSSSVSGKIDRTLSFKTIKLDSSTNTELSGNLALEQDADRMFLLSLLPYMQKVDGQRKLFVRQKLQNVLIDEFG